MGVYSESLFSILRCYPILITVYPAITITVFLKRIVAITWPALLEEA